MNGLQRIAATLEFQAVDRVPVIAQIFGHAAVLADVPLADYVRDGEVLARCQIQALARYGYDAVFALMDVNVETEALGSVLKYSRDRYPTVATHALADASGLETLVVPDPARAGRMPELLKAATILRNEVGDQVLVVGCVLGPMTLAVQLMGAETALFLAIDEPDRFSLLLDRATDVIVRFGLEQIKAGVHLPIIFDPAATPDVIPPAFYREFLLPRLKRICTAFKLAGAAANWLHTAGPALPILPYYPEAGVDIANIDFCVDPLDAIQALPRICIDGNIRPLSFAISQPAAIAAQSAHLLRTFKSRGGFILSSGCEIPPESKPENVAAMVAAVGRNACPR